MVFISVVNNKMVQECVFGRVYRGGGTTTEYGGMPTCAYCPKDFPDNVEVKCRTFIDGNIGKEGYLRALKPKGGMIIKFGSEGNPPCLEEVIARRRARLD